MKFVKNDLRDDHPHLQKYVATIDVKFEIDPEILAWIWTDYAYGNVHGFPMPPSLEELEKIAIECVSKHGTYKFYNIDHDIKRWIEEDLDEYENEFDAYIVAVTKHIEGLINVRDDDEREIDPWDVGTTE